MYSNPVTTNANGLTLTTCTPGAESGLTRIRYMAELEADHRVKAALAVSRETRGFARDERVLNTYEVRWTVGGKFFAVKKIATEAEALAVAADRWAKVVAKLEARAARLAA